MQPTGTPTYVIFIHIQIKRNCSIRLSGQYDQGGAY